MKKVVFFKEIDKLYNSLKYFDILDFKNKKYPVKLHMGERGNRYFPKPDFVKNVIAVLKNLPSDPFLFDTTVAYPGLRHRKKGYYKLAKIHGFIKKEVGCDVVIDDTGIPIKIDDRSYEVANNIVNSSNIFAISHVKGHVATGMGGAIKNFGMGGVTKETKIRMHHGSRPVYNGEYCTFCGRCSEVCPFNSIEVGDNFWKQDMSSCFGCGVCVDSCTNKAIDYKDADFNYVLACAAKACVSGKNVIYLNDVNRISKSCDCDPGAGPIICSDIGYLVSDDPVAIDKASIDIIHKVKPDIFEKVNYIDPLKQVYFAEDIHLGTSSYELINI